MNYQLSHLFLPENVSVMEPNITALSPKRLTILGLGDVGRTLAVALKTLSSEAISEIGIYDLNQENLSRVTMELSQIIALDRHQIPIVKRTKDKIFDCDIFVFTASKSVPEVGSDVKDVRMAQLEENAKIVKYYIENAKIKGYQGQFFIVSDPVDLLCKVAEDYAKSIDYTAMTSNKIRGFGLGVMYGRALYYAAQESALDFSQKGRVYGPHGADLIVLNDVFGGYDENISKALTKRVVEANLEIRALGYKPYIAPAISSGAMSITALLEGKWQHSAIKVGKVFLGVRNRKINDITEIEQIPYNKQIEQRIMQTIHNLEKNYEAYCAKTQ